MNVFQQIGHFFTQIESIVMHWSWWTPGVIGVSIILLPVIVFGPLSIRFQNLHEFIVQSFFIAAGYGLVALYALYGAVHYNKFLAGLVITLMFLGVFVFVGIMLFMTLVSISDYFAEKHQKEYTQRMQQLRALGEEAYKRGERW